MILHCNGAAGKLGTEPKHHALVPKEDKQSEEVLWKPRIVGFARATRLRSEAYERIEDRSATDAQGSVQVIRALYAAAGGTSLLAG